MPTKVPRHVHIRKWLPQNDILGHSRTKLFLTHSGNNGQHEALYHGVPMIAFYFWNDQKHNAHRIHKKGFAHMFNLNNSTANELYYQIMEVLSNEIYRGNIQRASQIYRNQPMTARQKSSFWIEHVLKYSSDHLKSGGTDLPLYAYPMLDILLAIFAAVLVVVIVITLLINFISRRCKILKNLSD